MSLPPDTGAVELAAYTAYVTRQLWAGGRQDGRAHSAVRQPRLLRELSGDGGEGRRGGLLASVVYTDDLGTCATVAVHGVFGPPPRERPAAGRLVVRVQAPLLEEAPASAGTGDDGVATGARGLALLRLEGFVAEALAGALDTRQLSVVPGVACWVLTVHATVLSADGGLRAALLHACLGALHGLALPRARLPDGTVAERRALRLACVPVAVTYGVLRRAPGEEGEGESEDAAEGQRLLVLADTTAAEEVAAAALVTVTVDESGGLVQLQQSGTAPLSPATLRGIIADAAAQAPALRKAIVAAGDN